MEAASLLPALERLCSAKMTLEFTDHQSETWLAALSVFPVGIVNRCLVEMSLDDDDFPKLGKVIRRCQLEMQKRATQVSQADPSKPTRKTVDAVAQAFGIEIE